MREFCSFLAGLMFILGVLIGHICAKDDMRRAAIERGHALYCPAYGEWAWKGECKTQPSEEG